MQAACTRRNVHTKLCLASQHRCFFPEPHSHSVCIHPRAASSSSNVTLTIGIAGVAANVVCAYSLFVLKNTGCGLPPGPYGLEGALEGVSYLAVVGIIGSSILNKVKTGKGLDGGPYGLLGAAEGFSYLTVLVGIAIAVLNYTEFGFIPGALPDKNCFGT